jgi:hypothetical protein
MRHVRRPDLTQILRETLRKLEQAEQSDSPALVELKRSILRSIAELELVRSGEFKAAA